jgi:predicted transcriptional regulator
MRQKNPLATIHQVLARLVEKGTVTVTIRNGVNCYRWIGEDGRDDVLKPATKSK